MIPRLVLALAFGLVTQPAAAIVGGGGLPAENISRAIVTIIGSRGSFCTGSLIAQDLVLTAAHCVAPGADYKLILSGESPPRLRDVRRLASHPLFSVAAIQAHRASADVALLQLTEPLPASKAPAPLGAPVIPIEVGSRLTIAGVGVTRRGEGKSGGTIRAADLAVTGKPAACRFASPIPRPAIFAKASGPAPAIPARRPSRCRAAARSSSAWCHGRRGQTTPTAAAASPASPRLTCTGSGYCGRQGSGVWGCDASCPDC
jgi:hypothetical protein